MDLPLSAGVHVRIAIAYQDGLIDKEDAGVRLEINSRSFLHDLQTLDGDVRFIGQTETNEVQHLDKYLYFIQTKQARWFMFVVQASQRNPKISRALPPDMSLSIRRILSACLPPNLGRRASLTYLLLSQYPTAYNAPAVHDLPELLKQASCTSSLPIQTRL